MGRSDEPTTRLEGIAGLAPAAISFAQRSAIAPAAPAHFAEGNTDPSLSQPGTGSKEPPPWVPFPLGEEIGHYEIIRTLGQGGMGDVYLARDTRLGRRVALKFLQRVDPQHSARFAAEARATAQLSHENIVALYDVAEHASLPYMVLEYVPGKTLSAWLKERRSDFGRGPEVPASRVAELMLPVARALHRAHEAGIVHRDLKPANIMLAESGVVKVLDFGIAKLLGDVGAPEPATALTAMPGPVYFAEDSLATPTMTQVGAVLGTQPYMAPEQWRAEPVDGRADLWALGIILYQMVVGEHPLAPLSPQVLSSVAQLELPMPSIRERRPELGKLAEIIDRCLIKRPAERLGSALELCRELEAIARPGADGSSGAMSEDNPYSGLAAFQEKDAARFFGREHAIEQLVARLTDLPLLAVVGPSGVGKSSLVRAGVIPALKRGGDAWEAFVLRPGPHPLAMLAELMLQHSWQRSAASDASAVAAAQPMFAEDHEAMVEQLLREPGYFAMQVRRRARRRAERVLLFVDQFEEVYTLARDDERDAFLACMAAAADDASSPLRVVLSLRHDFLDRVAAGSSALAELVGRGTVLVGPLDRRDLARALVAPAEAQAYRFESRALVTEMLDSLTKAASALPLLQFTAAKLWEGRDRQRRLLTEASYRAFGGVSGALASHADAVLRALGTAERRCARTLLLRLVTADRTRAIATRRELSELGGATTAELDRVLDRLIEARLVTVEGGSGGDSSVELSHESLIAAWPTLARWLEEEQGDAQFRARLRVTAREWEASGFAEGLLWRGDAEDEARRWHKRRGAVGTSTLSAREERYLTAVIALGSRERRRRRQALALLVVGLLVVVLVVSMLALRSRQAARRAETQRSEAERSAAIARNATRMAAARERQEDPTTVLALLREIEPGSVPRGWSELARWAAEAGVAETVLSHQAEVRSAAFSPDGEYLVTAAVDKLIRVWRTDGTGQPLVLRGHEDRVNTAAFSPDGLRIASASRDQTLRIWNADGTGTPLVLRGHTDRVVMAVWSLDGQRLASASYDNTVRLWRADTGAPLAVLRGHEDHVTAVAFSPDGRRVASASEDKTARVWELESQAPPVVLRDHLAAVTAVSFSPDGKSLVTASWDKTLVVRPSDGGGTPVVLRGHDGSVYAAAFSPDGQRIASASIDKTVRVWQADGAGVPLILRGHDGYVIAASWSRDGQLLASASWDKTARVWRPRGSGRAVVLRGHDEPVYAATASPDGKRVASASFDKTVRVWNADGSGRPLVLRGHEALVLGVSFSPDGRRIASASFDKTVRIWNANGEGEPLVLRGHEDVVSGAAFSPDGQRLISSSWDKTVRVWNADGSGAPLVLRGHTDRVLSAQPSPDGRRIVSAAWDQTVRVWNADGSGEPRVLRGHDDHVSGASFSPDGKRIVSAADDGTVRVWPSDGVGETVVLRGHDGAAYTRGERIFSPDGQRVISSSDDATIRVWNADGSGEPLVTRLSEARSNSVAWLPSGDGFVAASDDKTVVVWRDLEPLHHADSPKLWRATTYCMPLATRQQLLGFPAEQARADLARCERQVLRAR